LVTPRRSGLAFKVTGSRPGAASRATRTSGEVCGLVALGRGGTCGPAAYLPQIRLAQQHAAPHVRVLIVAQSCGRSAATPPSH